MPMLVLAVVAVLGAVGWAVLALTMPAEPGAPAYRWQQSDAPTPPPGCPTFPPGREGETFICLSGETVGP